MLLAIFCAICLQANRKLIWREEMLVLLVWYLRKKAAELSLCMPWSRGIAPLIPKLDGRRRWVVRFTPRLALTSEDDILLSFIRTLRGRRRRYGCFGEEINISWTLASLLSLGRGIKYLASSHTSHCTPSLWRWNWYRVPKLRPTTIWRRGNTQKKIYHILNYRESKYGSLDVQPVDWSLYWQS